MRKFWVMFLLGISTFLMFETGFCAEKFTGVNPKQPILPGGVIYYDEQSRNDKGPEQLNYYQYIYLELQGKVLRIRYTGRNDDTMQKEVNDQITIPVDGNDQAILSVNQVSSDMPTLKLLITVVDKDNGIKVEKYTGY